MPLFYTQYHFGKLKTLWNTSKIARNSLKNVHVSNDWNFQNHFRVSNAFLLNPCHNMYWWFSNDLPQQSYEKRDFTTQMQRLYSSPQLVFINIALHFFLGRHTLYDCIQRINWKNRTFLESTMLCFANFHNFSYIANFTFLIRQILHLGFGGAIILFGRSHLVRAALMINWHRFKTAQKSFHLQKVSDRLEDSIWVFDGILLSSVWESSSYHSAHTFFELSFWIVLAVYRYCWRHYEGFGWIQFHCPKLVSKSPGIDETPLWHCTTLCGCTAVHSELK